MIDQFHNIIQLILHRNILLLSLSQLLIHLGLHRKHTALRLRIRLGQDFIPFLFRCPDHIIRTHLAFIHQPPDALIIINILLILFGNILLVMFNLLLFVIQPVQKFRDLLILFLDLFQQAALLRIGLFL